MSTVLLAGGVAWQIQLLYLHHPGMYLDARANMSTFRATVLVQASTIALGLLRVC